MHVIIIEEQKHEYCTHLCVANNTKAIQEECVYVSRNIYMGVSTSNMFMGQDLGNGNFRSEIF